MKSSPSNIQLDTFIQDTLKSPDVDLHPFDWSEIEVLLRHEQKSISVGINKKSILIYAVAVIILIGTVGIFKIMRYYSSLPEETETLIPSTQNTFMAVDTQKTMSSDSSVSMIDTVKIDSSRASRNEEHKADSILVASDIFLKNSINKQSADTAKIIQKQDKKQKQNKPQPQFTDSSAGKTSIEQLPAIDTASKHLISEIKNALPVSPPDSSKFSEPTKKSKKNKKQKNTSVDSSKIKTESPSEIKSDSLKQQ
ncbi:MAG: hypothetical protein AABZ32_05650 [Bacteroidota bacterium]